MYVYIHILGIIISHELGIPFWGAPRRHTTAASAGAGAGCPCDTSDTGDSGDSGSAMLSVEQNGAMLNNGGFMGKS